MNKNRSKQSHKMVSKISIHSYNFYFSTNFVQNILLSVFWWTQLLMQFVLFKNVKNTLSNDSDTFQIIISTALKRNGDKAHLSEKVCCHI